MRSALFIFDFDGVIADSLTALYDIYNEFLGEFGLNGNKAEFDSLNGPSLLEIVTILKAKYHLKNEIDDLLQMYVERLSRVYENVKPNGNAIEILNFLKANHFTIALASSSKKSEIISVLKRFKIYDLFSFIVSGDEVEKAKPSPEIYNVVKSSYPDREYYVIEDSPMGIQSAKGAGMKTIFYNPGHSTIQQDVSYEIYDLDEVRKIVAEIDSECFTIVRASQINLNLVDHEPFLGVAQRDEIENIWENELTKRTLFNGDILSYLAHRVVGDVLFIECFTTEYKYFLAQLKGNLDLGIFPIGVSGIIIDENNNTLLGKRSNVTEYENFYEFLPAGSIDSSKILDKSINFQEKLIEEFSEETGIFKDEIKSIEPFCLVYDRSDKVYDICSKIYVSGLLNDQVKCRYNDEYEDIEIFSLKKDFRKILELQCVPTSRIILNNLSSEQFSAMQ
jgi:HAD superfamily hydrolase (TIGR01509 family)